MKAAGLQGPYYFEYKTYDWECMLKYGFVGKGSSAAIGTAAGKYGPGIASNVASKVISPLSGAYVGAAGTTLAEIASSPVGITVSVILAVDYVLKKCECNNPK